MVRRCRDWFTVARVALAAVKRWAAFVASCITCSARRFKAARRRLLPSQDDGRAGRVQKEPGRHPFRKAFHELQIGDSLNSAEREVTLDDIEKFAALSGDTFYAHMDEEAAARNPLFGGRVAHGYFLISAAAGLFVDPPYGPVLANYGIDRLRFVKPVKPGDRIKVRLTCKSKSLRADKGYGEVAWDTEITNQNGEVVASYDVLTMVSEQPVSSLKSGLRPF